MEKQSIETIVAALNGHQVRYLIVGGLAVIAHGHGRLTMDVDLMLAMDAENLRRVVAALKSLDYRPRVPVAFEDFIYPQKREQWAREKNMAVFSVHSPTHPTAAIDLFLENPVDFEAGYSNALHAEVAPGIPATFCSLDDLIAMKSKAARPRDLLDLEQLAYLKPDDTK